MAEHPESELASLIGSATELLRWEEEALGGQGFPAPTAVDERGSAVAVASGDSVLPSEIETSSPRERLRLLEAEASECVRCELHAHRSRSVFARGNPETDLVFVGEGPGYNEDQQGLPFVGRAGQLLDRMIGAMGYGRDEVYICNVVKCRPPDNRTPLPSEAAACAHFLVPQLQAVNPKVIVALGRCAAENLQCVPPTGKWRGVWGDWQGIPVMPTYHPAFLLRSPEFKKPVWEDLKAVLHKLGRPLPQR